MTNDHIFYRDDPHTHNSWFSMTWISTFNTTFGRFYFWWCGSDSMMMMMMIAN